MSTEPMNSRLIVPAPAAARRDAGIDWYEVVLPDGDRSQLQSTDTRKLVSTMTAALDSTTIRSAISLEGRSDQVKIEVTLESSGPDNHTAHVAVNNHSYAISGNPRQPGSIKADRTLDLAPEETEAIQHFSHLHDSFFVLAQATRNSWSCGACLLLGAGVVTAAGCCATGNPGCCAGALTAGGTLVANCDSVCPDPSPVAVGGMAGVPVLLSE